MKSFATRILVAFLALVLVTTAAAAQQRRTGARRARSGAGVATFGGHVGYNFDASAAVIGAQASLPITPQVDAFPSFDYYTVSGGTEWAINLDGRLRPPAHYQSASVYVGAGLNILHASAGAQSNTETNVNLFGGLEGRRGRMRPYAEARLIVGHGSSFQIQGGVSFPLR